jgi:Spx/MgsR family transcriptional regulator
MGRVAAGQQGEMMKPLLYLYRACTSCRNAAAYLDANGVSYDVREYFKEPFTREELESLLARASLRAPELLATRSTPYRKERLGEQQLGEGALLNRMLTEPRLIRRPILVTDDEVIVGFDRRRYEAVAQELAAEQARNDPQQV